MYTPFFVSLFLPIDDVPMFVRNKLFVSAAKKLEISLPTYWAMVNKFWATFFNGKISECILDKSCVGPHFGQFFHKLSRGQFL
jgi:hypothetical protein